MSEWAITQTRGSKLQIRRWPLQSYFEYGPKAEGPSTMSGSRIPYEPEKVAGFRTVRPSSISKKCENATLICRRRRPGRSPRPKPELYRGLSIRVENRLIVYPREPHGFTKKAPPGSPEPHPRLYDKHLKRACQPPSSEEHRHCESPCGANKQPQVVG